MSDSEPLYVVVLDTRSEPLPIMRQTAPDGAVVTLKTGPPGRSGTQWRVAETDSPSLEDGDLYGDLVLASDGTVYSVQGDIDDPETWFLGNTIDLQGPPGDPASVDDWEIPSLTLLFENGLV